MHATLVAAAGGADFCKARPLLQVVRKSNVEEDQDQTAGFDANWEAAQDQTVVEVLLW